MMPNSASGIGTKAIWTGRKPAFGPVAAQYLSEPFRLQQVVINIPNGHASLRPTQAEGHQFQRDQGASDLLPGPPGAIRRPASACPWQHATYLIPFQIGEAG
jgi:hypothetical protein